CVIYAPTDVAGPLPSIVALVAALAGIVQIASQYSAADVEAYLAEFNQAYQFLTQPDLQELEDREEEQ
ncbi:MAG: hypothetical protein KDE47_00670, partial [Caldilineaceae bacterium]|nr:hypothetical protein [Caldilineaceae bacterium]